MFSALCQLNFFDRDGVCVCVCVCVCVLMRRNKSLFCDKEGVC